MVGESDVVLDESRVLEPRGRTFFPTFAEWASDGNVEQVLRSREFDTDDFFLYTVPENNTLFITSAFVSGMEQGNNSTHGGVAIKIIAPVGNKILFHLCAVDIDHTNGGHGGNRALSLAFPMPIRANSGERIQLDRTGMASGSTTGGFAGFLLPKKISIR